MWHSVKDKSIILPSKSSLIIVVNNNLYKYYPNRYSIISVEKFLENVDQPYNHWTHWMEIPKVE